MIYAVRLYLKPFDRIMIGHTYHYACLSLIHKQALHRYTDSLPIYRGFDNNSNASLKRHTRQVLKRIFTHLYS